MFKTVKDAIDWIESVKRFGDKLDLSRMEIACELLNHPERNLNVIHIAGTNGKGSTVSYLKHILLEHGYHVGTFTSPYIVRFNERITYDYNDISDEELLVYINRVNSLYNKVLSTHHEVITFFELITLISFMYFNDHPCDFVLYEVGLGGTLDATNVVMPLITAITSISFDHMGVLGDTLESIALNKLGIVKDNVPLVTAIDQEALFPVFEYHTAKHHSKLSYIDRDQIKNVSYGSHTKFNYKNNSYKLSMLGTHQVFNACLALDVLFELQEMKLITLEMNNVKLGLLKTYWPGRLEQFGNVYLDGAHNVGGATALKNSIQEMFKGKHIKVLYATMADKEYFDVIGILDPVVDEIYFTEFDYPRCEKAIEAYHICSSVGAPTHSQKFVADNAINTYKELKKALQPNEILLVTGSLYFVSYMRKEL